MIEKFKNKFTNESCYILGNGPSLKDLDFEKVKNKPSFALNKISLLYNKTDWRPSFYVNLSERNSSDWIDAANVSIDLNIPCFINKQNKKQFKQNKNIHYLNVFGDENVEDKDGEWSDDITKMVTKNGSTILGAVQIAVYMGFNEIYFVGCDLNYQPNGKSHFDPNYFNFDKSLCNAYNQNILNCHELIKRILDKKNIKVFNCSSISTLDMYEKFEL